MERKRARERNRERKKERTREREKERKGEIKCFAESYNYQSASSFGQQPFMN